MRYPIDISEEAGVRYLHFGSPWIQGAMRIARPWQLELDYTRDMMVSLLLREDKHFPHKVLLIGLGAGSLAKFLYRHFPLAHLTVVEIEPRVVIAARQFFKLPEDPPRIDITIENGARFVASSDKTWDLILVDGFDDKAHPGDLDTLPFYQHCRARLSDNGILAANLLRYSRGYQASLERIVKAFQGRTLVLPPTESGNAIVLAASGAPIRLALGTLRNKAQSLKARTRLNLLPTLARLPESHPCPRKVLSL